eukprot:CAMPEP_0184495268 /NCGR_PEP_ID=MMETSP0113_2-20130426/30823_1 /TAXON_ID=91329 /ORGANISM="Norrisiella sphaerica, Strain BC52" /LENGTH=37 /DNA_ID= /DNA_START= /DNA_END= /DNA_ORIENTATION=
MSSVDVSHNWNCERDGLPWMAVQLEFEKVDAMNVFTS